jgi:methanogenic corrinoid protein MtbC1
MVSETYRDPIYNLKAVVAETGVTADALRAWQRRYGLPQPARTEAGHRVYSRRDIDTIKWLVARQEEGLRIGRAVKLWYSLEDEGYDPLQKMPVSAEATRPPTGDRLISLREDWVDACLSFDELRAERTLAEAFALYPPEAVLSQIIREGIAEIGHHWYEGHVTPAQEHFASELAMRHLKSMIQAAPGPTRRGRILLACPPDEEHVLGLVMLGLLMRRAGWDVINLGADVPIEEIEETIESTKPQLVILAAQQLRTAGHLLEMARAIARKGVSVAFGGGIFNRAPALRERVPGHFLGPSLEEATQTAKSLMVSARTPPSIEAAPETYQQALACCVDRFLLLEARVWTTLEPLQYDPEALRELNTDFVHAVVAALEFGDIDLVGEYLDWLEGLEGRARVPREVLYRYLEAYRQAAEVSLGDSGTLIINWLDRRLQRETGSDNSG